MLADGLRVEHIAEHLCCAAEFAGWRIWEFLCLLPHAASPMVSCIALKASVQPLGMVMLCLLPVVPWAVKNPLLGCVMYGDGEDGIPS